MMQIIFFAASMLVLLSGHAFFWYILVRFFHITALNSQIVVAIIISGLFLSTVLSSYMIHKWDNLFTRTYYLLAGFWIGLFVNLCLMAVVVAAIKYAGIFFNFHLPDAYIKLIFFGGGFLISLIGVYRVVVPQITEYEVQIKDLPDAWDNKVIVQLSDVHLGPVYRKNFFYRLIDRVNELQPEAVFVTGDLFDGMESEFGWMNHPFARLKAPKGIYYSFGNHDLYLGFNRVVDLLQENPVTILDNKMVMVDGLQIIGINYSFNSDFDLEAAILKQVNYSRSKPSILMLHAPKNIDLAKKAGIDLQLSGHTHDGQLWPFNLIVKWSHQGYGYGLFHDEDFSLVVNSGAGSWGPAMRTAARSEIVKITLKKK